MTQFKPIEEVYPECMRESFYPGGDLCFDAPGDSDGGARGIQGDPRHTQQA